MTELTAGLFSSHASDTAVAVVPHSSATARTASRMRQLRSLSKPAKRSFHWSMRVPAGADWSFRYLPLRKPPASGDQGMMPKPEFAAQRHVLAFEVSRHQAVLHLQ